MSIQVALAAGILALGTISCGDVRTSFVGPGNSRDTFPPAANINGQSQPRGNGSIARATETSQADPNPPGDAIRTGNPGYGYTLKQPPRPD